MAKFTRKGKNPGAVDAWLDKLGYYRKNIAYDETCLFRAISEQIFSCQIYHERCRREILEYGRSNYHQFTHLVKNDESEWMEHMDKLEIHMVICGNIEIEIASRKYEKNVMLFDSINRRVHTISDDKYDGSLLLCSMGEDHYDVVYKTEYIQTAGFCQSIVYNILYENVFNIPNVTNIVQVMLYDKPNTAMTEDIKTLKQEDENCNELEYMLRTNIAPFPYKIAKALDPTIYRNIEYDTWTETRKEFRLGDWYYGDNNLILGTCCLLSTENGTLQCYIQEILKQQNQCVVYITSLAQKRTVNYSDLSPEADAKPWPLPYRFAKNVTSVPCKLELPDKDKKPRRRRDKKRTSSKCGSDSSNSLSAGGGACDQNDSCRNVNVYTGCPLQVQQHAEGGHEDQSTPAPDATTQLNYPEVGYTGVTSWEQTSPPANGQGTTMWPQTPTGPQSVFTFVSKPVIPGTPEMPYTSDPYYYNIPRYSAWTNTTPPVYAQSPEESGQIEVSPTEPYRYAYYDNVYNSPVAVMPDDRSVYSTPMTPTNPPAPIEIYPSYFSPPAPVTPVIYAPPEILIASPHVPVFSPPLEMPYISTTPFICPPTPPAAWYPSAINSQGFIFPTSVATQNVTHRI